MDTPIVDANGNITWPNMKPAPLDTSIAVSGTSPAERDAIRNTLNPKREEVPISNEIKPIIVGGKVSWPNLAPVAAEHQLAGCTAGGTVEEQNAIRNTLLTYSDAAIDARVKRLQQKKEEK
jgi:hypothetical protein